MVAERRNKLQIIGDILTAIQRKGGKIKPTHVLYRSNLSYDRLKKYIDELNKKGLILIEEEDGKTRYSLTNKGMEFIVEINKINEITDAFGI